MGRNWRRLQQFSLNWRGFKGIPLRPFAPFAVNDFAFSEIWEGFEHTSARNELGLIQTI
jgi:hypothetical protein